MSQEIERNIRAAVVQIEATPDRPDVNFEKIRERASAAAADGAQLIIFPEMCLLGYWHLRRQSVERLKELAMPVDGEYIEATRALSAELGVGIGVGYLEEASNGNLYNSYSVCLPNGAIHTHRKLHAFEHEAISSGSEFTVFDTPWGFRAGILICWDNNLVENVRATALGGASVLIAPHQTGGTDSRSPRGMKPISTELWDNRESDPAAIEAAFRGRDGRGWITRWLPSRAHDNGLFVLFSNGVGRDDNEIRTGNSMIIDPYGEIIAETWAAAETTVISDLDLSLVPMSSGRRWMRGRRPELYDVLTQSSGTEFNARDARFSREPVQLSDQTGLNS